MTWQILEGDCLEQLRELPAGSVQTCVTSPPYWGLRDYGNEGQLGLEPTPEQYVENLVRVFREVRRVLRDDGTLWLNLGDSYASAWACNRRNEVGAGSLENGKREARPNRLVGKLKEKDLVGIPWRVAFALQADGWWLRSDIIWSKPNPMPESVTDRPTRAHEYVFLLTKSARYFYDADAIREDDAGITGGRQRAALNGDDRYRDGFKLAPDRGDGDRSLQTTAITGSRNKRSVWTVTTQPYPEAHFATFPPKLVEPCILAGSPPKCCGECGAPWGRITQAETTGRDAAGVPTGEWDGERGIQRHRAARRMGDSSVTTTGWRTTCPHDDPKNSLHISDVGTVPSVVLDPFAGAGTTGVVALRHNRDFIGIELNPDYCELARNRIRDDAPLFNADSEIAA